MTAAAGLPPRVAVGRIFDGGGGAWLGRVTAARWRLIPVEAQSMVLEVALHLATVPPPAAAAASDGQFGPRWARASLFHLSATGWCGAPSFFRLLGTAVVPAASKTAVGWISSVQPLFFGCSW